MTDEGESVREEDAIVHTPHGIRWRASVLGNSPEVFGEE